MIERKNINVNVFGTDVSILTDEPIELLKLAKELDTKLRGMQKDYPNIKNTVILTLAYIQTSNENKKLENQLTELLLEREKLTKTMQGFV